MNPPNVMLKTVVLTHFVLSVWGCMGNWLPQSYVYVHAGLLLCGLWAIASSESTDAVIMMMASLGFSALQDIILLSLYEPRGYSVYESGLARVSADATNEYRFALGMCILNLLLKPLSGFVLFRIYVARKNQTDFNIPGIDHIPGLGGMGGSGGGGGYESIGGRNSAPYSGMPVETAGPHATVVKE